MLRLIFSMVTIGLAQPHKEPEQAHLWTQRCMTCRKDWTLCVPREPAVVWLELEARIPIWRDSLPAWTDCPTAFSFCAGAKPIAGVGRSAAQDQDPCQSASCAWTAISDNLNLTKDPSSAHHHCRRDNGNEPAT